MLLSLFVASLLFVSPVYAEYSPPAPDGFVTDTVGVLSSAVEQDLEQRLDAYRKETTNEIAILIVDTIGEEVMADTAFAVGRTWGVGKGEADNGVLILLATEDREIFIATGYGAEGQLPDLLVGSIIDEKMLPYFQNGDYSTGIQSGVAALMQEFSGEEAERFAPEVPVFDVSHIDPTFILFVLIFGCTLLMNLLFHLSRSSSWWAGGVIAGMIGVLLFSWAGLVSFMLIGFLLDAWLSWLYRKSPQYKAFVDRERRARTRGYFMGGFGGKDGGGFGGFGGGSFGGGGAGRRW